MPDIDFGELRKIAEKKERYKHQLQRLQKLDKQTSCIEDAVTKASDNIAKGTRSFVIYGEPQSGKTEMMICLTAKLADQGAKVIIHQTSSEQTPELPRLLREDRPRRLKAISREAWNWRVRWRPQSQLSQLKQASSKLQKSVQLMDQYPPQ
jgi:ABC-type phosphonate transport system ATPase subunit